MGEHPRGWTSINKERILTATKLERLGEQKKVKVLLRWYAPRLNRYTERIRG